MSGIDPEDAYLDRIPTSVISVSEFAHWLKLSRTHLARKLHDAEALGSIGWVGQRGHSVMWVSRAFFDEYMAVQAAKLAVVDEAFEAWLLQTTKDLAAGKLDEELVYRKSKKENDVKEELVLVMTGRGLEPAHETTAPIDYDHYLQKQIGPVCDVILPFLDTSFSRVAGAQTSLF